MIALHIHHPNYTHFYVCEHGRILNVCTIRTIKMYTKAGLLFIVGGGGLYN